MNAKKLNGPQQLASSCIDKPVCILASAGCGKTTVLVQHYLELIEKKGLKPGQIVVTTFSEKSAADIKQGILKALRERGKTEFIDEFAQAPISTLHGLGGRILRDASLLLGLDPHFQILDENDSAYLKKQSLESILEKHLKEDSPWLQNLISAYPWKSIQSELFQLLNQWPSWKDRFANSGKVENSLEQKLREAWQKIFSDCIADYESKKLEKQALDFNDLEERAIGLLKRHPWVVRHYQSQWKAFLVDEFQDTSERQDLLLSHLLGLESQEKIPSSLHLAIVGDPKQSIYGFRGAKAHIFEKFQQIIEASGGISVSLDENYRSPQGILDFVNKVFGGIFPAYSALQGIFDAPQALEILKSNDETLKWKAEEKRLAEAELFAQRIAELLQEGHKASEIFMLFRASAPMPLYLKALKGRGLPVFVKSGESLLERQEILDLLHAFQILVQNQDELAWIGLLRSPAFGISDEQLLEFRLNHPGKAPWEKLHPLAEKLMLQNAKQKPSAFLEWWFEESQVLCLYNAEDGLRSKAENLLQFYNVCFEWEAKNPGHIPEFMEEIHTLLERGIHLSALSDQLNPSEAITFMTIHQSKGLNLPIVFLPDLKQARNHAASRSLFSAYGESWGIKVPEPKPGLKKNLQASPLFEANLSAIQRQEVNEENRIFYVATTRSMKKLILGFLPSSSARTKEEEISNYQSKLVEAAESLSSIHWIEKDDSHSMSAALPQNSRYFFETYPDFAQNDHCHFAVTQLECYLQSPAEYWKRYLYQIPVEPSTQRRENKASSLSALERGEILHQALHLSTQQKLSYREILESLAAKHNLSSFALAELTHLEEILERTQAHAAFRKIREAKESYSEIAFRLQLSPYVLQGAMDRLIFDGKSWQVIDFKSHALRPTQALPPTEDFEFQLKTYCLASSKMLNKAVLEAQVYFMLVNKTHVFHFSEEQLEAHAITLKNLMQEINKSAKMMNGL